MQMVKTKHITRVSGLTMKCACQVGACSVTRHIYRLKYQNGDGENKMELKSHPVSLGLKGRPGSNKVNPLLFVFFCVFIPSSSSYFLT